ADSQLLFSRKNNDWFLDRLQSFTNQQSSFAVYIGAANGNEPAFYEMAQEAFSSLGIAESVFLKSGLEDLQKHQNKIPSVILLSGGDVQQGWQLLSQPDIRNWLLNCYHRGCLLLGISAGAIHLTNALDIDSNITPLLNLLPVIPLAHEENEDWPGETRYLTALELKGEALSLETGEPLFCLKLPFGSGVWVNSSGMVTFGKNPAQLQQQNSQIELCYHED
ncbi:MAG: Type 1 glutamine amidotransferase-like domain-containing protein, partial [Pseudomonadales bacterium]|nr:Type 1 glutamine amidotransferase-like domain-containing protein [Pseudomonadales bacterium]